MRGDSACQANMLLGMTPNDFIPAGHPIRAIRDIVDGVLTELSTTFDNMYKATGRPSVPPEHLLKATILMALYTVRSERQFCERLRSAYFDFTFSRLKVPPSVSCVKANDSRRSPFSFRVWARSGRLEPSSAQNRRP